MTLGKRRIGNPLLDIKTRLPKDIVDTLDAVSLEFRIPRVLIIRLAIKEFLYRVKRDKRIEEQAVVRRRLSKPSTKNNGDKSYDCNTECE